MKGFLSTGFFLLWTLFVEDLGQIERPLASETRSRAIRKQGPWGRRVVRTWRPVIKPEDPKPRPEHVAPRPAASYSGLNRYECQP